VVVVTICYWKLLITILSLIVGLTMQKIFRSSLTVEKIGGRFKQPNASIRSVPFLGLGGTRAQSIQSRVRNPLATALMSGPQFDSLAAKVYVFIDMVLLSPPHFVCKLYTNIVNVDWVSLLSFP